MSTTSKQLDLHAPLASLNMCAPWGPQWQLNQDTLSLHAAKNKPQHKASPECTHQHMLPMPWCRTLKVSPAHATNAMVQNSKSPLRLLWHLTEHQTSSPQPLMIYGNMGFTDDIWQHGVLGRFTEGAGCCQTASQPVIPILGRFIEGADCHST